MNDAEIQVASLERGPRANAESAYGADLAGGSPWKALHRKLRGRYVWAVLLALLGLAGGGYFGWGMTKPEYRCQGVIAIAPTMPTAEDPAGLSVLPMFEKFLAKQVYDLTGSRATGMALDTEVWRRTGKGSSPEMVNEFEANRVVFNAPHTSLLVVQYTDTNADHALAGVQALMEVYQALSVDLNSANENLSNAQTQLTVLTSRLTSGNDLVFTLTAEYGGIEGMEMRHRAAVTRVLETEESLGKLQAMIDEYQEPTDDKAAPAEEISLDMIALEVPSMDQALTELHMLKSREEDLVERRGDKDLELRDLRRKIKDVQDRIDRITKAWRRSRTTQQAGGATLEELTGRKARLIAYLRKLQDQNRKLGQIRLDVERTLAANEEVKRQISGTTKLVAQLESQLVGSGRISISDEGRKPTKYFKDRRLTYAVALGLMAALLGVLLVMLIGHRDSRLKDAGSVDHSLARVRLLGLMPSVGASPEKAEGRALAAHCVHQIRTFLQIGHARQGGACIGISGPGVGSGKTTLTTALGVSFGSSGTRTLLVDADLSGRGLTWRVSQLLLARARRAAAGERVEQARLEDSEALDSALESAIDLMTLQPESSGWPEASELTELLDQALERNGLREAKASGVIDDLFALADLLFGTDVRDELASRLMISLGEEGVLTFGSPAEWIPPHVLELEAKSAGFNGAPLDRYLYRTGIDSLSFLPLRGLGQRGAVSSATISNILERIRTEFDVALVDTGPVPGTVETSMVAAHADSVVLVVSPEDHRPDAERAVAHMEEVGARIAGIVFNRAGTREIIRTTSMSRPSPQRGVTRS